MASVATWSTTAASNTSVGGISTDGNVTLVNQIDNMFRGQMAEVATSRDDGTIINVYPRGYLHGLTLSNNASDATNDIDISAGECVASDSPYWRMALASTLTKRLDATWAVGTGNGGLDTGSIADGWYHIWLIARSDTGVVDALFSASATSPTMPANYDRKRLLWSVKRVSAALKPFVQDGDDCVWVSPINDISTTTATTAALATLAHVPTGMKVLAKLRGILQNNTTISASTVLLSSPDEADNATNSPAGNLHAQCQVVSTPMPFNADIRTNTSGQIRHRGGNATTGLNVVTTGFVHPRGRT